MALLCRFKLRSGPACPSTISVISVVPRTQTSRFGNLQFLRRQRKYISYCLDSIIYERKFPIDDQYVHATRIDKTAYYFNSVHYIYPAIPNLWCEIRCRASLTTQATRRPRAAAAPSSRAPARPPAGLASEESQWHSAVGLAAGGLRAATVHWHRRRRGFNLSSPSDARVTSSGPGGSDPGGAAQLRVTSHESSAVSVARAPATSVTRRELKFK